MRKSRLLAMLAVTVASLAFISVATAADQQVVKVGKKGEAVFTEPTQIGDVTLKPGHYRFQHRVQGDDHLVSFTQLLMSQGNHVTGTTLGAKDSGEIKCRVEPMDKKASETRVTMSTEGGVHRITRIEIAGENVAHVF